MEQACCVENQTGQSVCICPYEELLSLIGKKWVVLILRLINAAGSIGYNIIYNRISGITPKAFDDKLKLLVGAGFVKRRILSQNPLRVHYSLTPNGKKFLTSLDSIFSEAKVA